MIEKSENLEPKIVEKIQHRPLTSHKRTLSSNVTLSEALKIGDRNLNKQKQKSNKEDILKAFLVKPLLWNLDSKCWVNNKH